MHQTCQREFPVENLLDWFERARRPLPWREQRGAYAVWVSEVMLQQTRAEVVVGYFCRWMAQFPTVSALAAAPVERVIKAWEGLGYYARARHLHAAARYFVEHHGGEIPSTYEQLIRVKGLGRYTVGAILSFAFGQRCAAVDGNVARVLSRYFGIRGNIRAAKAQKELWERAEDILPQERGPTVVEGLIELGALVCKREPLCAVCPLKEGCVAYARGMQRELPEKGARRALTLLERRVLVVTQGEALLVHQVPPGGVMAGLYEFPWEPLPLHLVEIATLPVQTHHFTRFKVTLYPTLYKAETQEAVAGYVWVSRQEAAHLPFSAGHKRIYAHIAHGEFDGLGRSGNPHPA